MWTTRSQESGVRSQQGIGLAVVLVAAALLAVLVTGCYAQQMATQPRYNPLEPSALFADGQSARQPVSDTVARGQLSGDTLLTTGTERGGVADRFPFPVTRDVLVRGRDRFEVYCSPCHGLSGYGDGMVVQRGFIPPPSFHTDALRQAPVGHIFQVATEGLGAMPSYAAQVPVRDRWAIVAYVKALQVSQHASVDDLPADLRQQLESQP
jgi:mono/diheme cytochrome c family protein